MLQPMRAADAAAAAALFARCFPARAHEVASWNSPEPDARTRRWVALEDARVVACGATWHTGDAKFRIDLAVDAAVRGRGIGGRMLEVMAALALRDGARTLQARADATARAALAFLERRDFRETMRMHRMELDLRGAPVLDAAAAAARLEAHGLSIATMAGELARTTDVYQRVGEVYDAAGDEWPDPDPGGRTKQPLNGERVHAMFQRWSVSPDAVFIARHDETYAGFAGVGESGRSIGTGTRPEYRNLGIATALRLRVVAWARARDLTTLQSASGNPAMVHVNEKLGFRRTATEVRLVRRLA